MQGSWQSLPTADFRGCGISDCGMAGRVHFWPFDGWEIPPSQSAVVEVYPALWSRTFPQEERDGHQHDAYSIAHGLRRADRTLIPEHMLNEVRCNTQLRIARETIQVRPAQPFGDGESVMLMAVAAILWERSAPKSRVHFRHCRLARWNLPSVEGPEMNATDSSQPDISQPGKSAVSRFRNRPLHVKVKDRLCAAGSYLRHSPPVVFPDSRASIAANALADEVHIDIVVGWPM